MDPGLHSDQVTAAPGGPRRPSRAGCEEEIWADRETMGGGFTTLISQGPNARPASDQPASDRPASDCGIHSIPPKYAAAVKDDSERAVHGRVLVVAATKAWKEKPDDDLRPMTPLEEEALASWTMGGIVLPSPPGFLACTHTHPARVAMLEYYKAYFGRKGSCDSSSVHPNASTYCGEDTTSPITRTT